MSNVREKLIVALDVGEFDKAKWLVDILYPTVRIFKVGAQLFTSCGPEIIRIIQRKGAKVFLDLKFHDIPNTVAGAVRAATRWGVFMFTVHTLGGTDMLREAVKSARITAAQLNIEKPKILGVTVLTSTDNRGLKDVGISRSLNGMVAHLARVARNQRLDGVVASAREILHIRRILGRNFIIVTPGIRPEGAGRDDQRRVTTPAEAIKKGADYIVVGRPVTEARDPKLEAEKILAEMKDAEEG